MVVVVGMGGKKIVEAKEEYNFGTDVQQITCEYIIFS